MAEGTREKPKKVNALRANRPYDEPLFDLLESVPGLDVAVTTLDRLMAWGASNSLWVFPMATSCCGIELMATATARVDVDRMGSIMRGTPRQCDVMVVAGTITVKMAPRVKKLWDQMPEPKWVLAMGSCAISGDFYRDIYSVVPGIDTFLPVDVYVPGCPPNPEQLMAGLMRLQEKIRLQQAGNWVEPATRPETAKMILPAVRRMSDGDRDPLLGQAQLAAAMGLGHHGYESCRAEKVADAASLAAERAPAAATEPVAAVDTDAAVATDAAVDLDEAAADDTTRRMSAADRVALDALSLARQTPAPDLPLRPVPGSRTPAAGSAAALPDTVPESDEIDGATLRATMRRRDDA